MTDKTLPPFTIHGGSTSSLDTLVRKKHNKSRDRFVLCGVAAAVVLAVLVSGSIVLAFYMGEIAKQTKSPGEVSESTNDEYEESLLELVGGMNCTEVTEVLEKLQQGETRDLGPAVEVSRHVEFKEYLRGRASEIQCQVDETYFYGDKLDADSEETRAKRSIRYCPSYWVGDGWCDPGCNTAGYRYDDGDCCPDTCGARRRRYRCGIAGYNCHHQSGPPAAFTSSTRLCYRWYPDGDGGQCGGGAARHLCANVDRMTPYYRDDTDNRGGGCRMSWRIESSYSASWFRNMQLCYRWYADGDGGQCGSAGGGGPNGEFCAAVNQWTTYYRDDTDRRGGGCRMSWRLRLPYNAPAWARDLNLCYYWYPDGDGGQCGGGVSRHLCARANSYTPYYRDDTDNRGGGCRMSWGIKLN
ncbi:uncharacterized protein LOC144923024 [Branchiostoma floridae x Branchiostoma belcheri]